MGKDLNGKELGKGISQRKTGEYLGRFVDRFGQRKCIYDRDLRMLKRKLETAIKENELKHNIVNDKITLDEWFSQWMMVYKQPIIRENTRRYYTIVYKNIISPRLGRYRLSEITQLQVQALINRVKEQGYEWETQNKVRVLLIDMFNRAMEDDFVTKNPAKSVRTASIKPDEERRVLTQEEQASFFETAAGTFYANAYVVQVNTGLRPGELFALSEKDLDFEKKCISVTKTLLYEKFEGDEERSFHYGDPKTKKSIRVVPMNRICETALKRQIVQKSFLSKKYKGLEGFENVLFTTKFNTPINTSIYNDSITRIIAELNLVRDNLEEFEKFSGHTFRHTFATRCIEAGVSPKTLQSYLGHATLQMTMNLYVHVTEKFKQEEMELLENELNKIEVSDSDIERKYEEMQRKESNLVKFTNTMIG